MPVILPVELGEVLGQVEVQPRKGREPPISKILAVTYQRDTEGERSLKVSYESKLEELQDLPAEDNFFEEDQ
jgi:hypothetical protein